MYFFSIVVTSYNNGDFLLQAVESIMTQSFSGYEVLVVDDCSEDGSLSELQCQINKNDFWKEKITCFSFSENKGVSEARNFGVEKASGDYIVFIDGDDFHIGESLQTLYDAILTHEFPQVLIFPFEKYTFSGEFMNEFFKMDGLLGSCSGKDLVEFVPDLNINPSPWNKVINREYWCDNKFIFNVKLRRCQDLELMPYVWCKAESVVVLSDYLYGYRTQKVRARGILSAPTYINYIELAVIGLLDYFIEGNLIKKSDVRGCFLELIVHQFNLVLKGIKRAPSYEAVLLFDECLLRILERFDVSYYKLWENKKGKALIWDLILLKSRFSIGLSVDQKYLFLLIRLHYLKVKILKRLGKSFE